MNIIFDGDYLIHKTFSIFSGYHPNMDLETLFQSEERKAVFYRKLITDFCSAVNKIKDIEKVIFVFDSTSWRYELHPNYKHKLEKEKQPGIGQFYKFKDWFIQKLSDKGFITSREEGMEGDDLIYYWAKYFEKKKLGAVIISGDGDLKQLVSPYVSQFNNNSKNLGWFHDERVKELPSCFNPAQITPKPVDPNYEIAKKIIIGDSGDNIDGVMRGFGEKTFDKMWKDISDYELPQSQLHLSIFLAKSLLTYKKAMNDDLMKDYAGKISFNIKMVWLNENIYPANFKKAMTEQKMTKSINSYNYFKPFSLEHFLNMAIK
jgi:5'-3' exonuclease